MLSCVGFELVAPGVGGSAAIGSGEGFAGGHPNGAGSRGIIGLQGTMAWDVLEVIFTQHFTLHFLHIF